MPLDGLNILKLTRKWMEVHWKEKGEGGWEGKYSDISNKLEKEENKMRFGYTSFGVMTPQENMLVPSNIWNRLNP